MTKLMELIKCIESKHIYIHMHNYPDQDAIASAFGLKTLLSHCGIDSTISYHGMIDRNSTLKMIELLNIPIHPVDESTRNEEDEIIIVDGQKGNINFTDFVGDEMACIDHHKLMDTDYYKFYDIRSNVGACSSIIAAYFFENDIPVPAEVATALLYGIEVDTAQLTRGVSALDLEAFTRLYSLSDLSILRIFETCVLNFSDLNTYSNAINNLKTYGSAVISDLGEGCSEGILGTVCDFLLTISDINFAVVYSHRAGGLKFSLRSNLSYVDASRIIRKALEGFGDGGGHIQMAAGFVPDVTTDNIRHIASAIEDRILLLYNNALEAGNNPANS